MTVTEETCDAVVIGSGFGGAITAFHLAEAGARVVVLERGPRLEAADFQQSFEFGSSSTRIFDFTAGEGMSVLAGNCVGGGSVVYFAAMPRTPGFVFERRGSLNRRLWPAEITRASLDPWYDRVEQALPVTRHGWDEVSFPGGVWAALCDHAGHTANPLPSAVDTSRCTSCNWMMAGCREDAKQSMLLNYLPGAERAGTEVRPLHEVQMISREAADQYVVDYSTVHPVDYREHTGTGRIRCKVVVVAAGAAATPVILQRSRERLGGTLPHAVGKYFSGNGERINVAQLREDRLAEQLGLDAGGAPYRSFQVGRGPVVSTWDLLDGDRPEFTRFSVEQLYFPPGLGTILAQATEPEDDGPAWFGLGKKRMLDDWQSWLMLFQLIEDDNEGVFGAPPPTGNAVRLSQQLLGRGTLRYRPRASTLAAWAAADEFVRGVVEDPGFGTVTPWSNDLVGAYTVHPLASCRVGDDPTTSALDPTHELRGHEGIFVVDGSAVPTALTVNPSNTIAALAERAAPHVIRRLRARGADVTYRGTLPR